MGGFSDCSSKRVSAWQKKLSLAASSTEDLREWGLAGDLSDAELQELRENFDIRVPESFRQRILESEPLRRQVEPVRHELVFLPEELADPIGDEVHSPIKGLTHRYANRALIKLTHLCGVYCRFCFRRYKVSQEGNQLTSQEMRAVLSYLLDHREIREVILTGGDPLILPDAFLFKFLGDLAAIPHLRVVRFHTRIPSVLPERITSEFCRRLNDFPFCSWVVAHINSADELNQGVVASISRLVQSGIPVLSQSVLLQGVNTSFGQLQELFEQLVEHRVRPYYLHYPDLAQGTHHFRIPLEDALELYQSLRGQLSGICIPHFILDIPGGAGKISLPSAGLVRVGERTWKARSPLTGDWIQFSYPPQTGLL